MFSNLFPLLSFVLITTFTPGPANISSASMGMLHGYRRTLNYLGGLTAGVFMMMMLGGGISGSLLHLFPSLEPTLRYAGALYILYLAFSILKASYTFTEKEARPLGFGHGVLLQVSNPKLVVYAFTLFSAFLAPITGNAILIVLAAILLAAAAFCAISLWALFGTVIRTRLHSPRWRILVNVVLALFLVYTAVELAGIL